MTLDRFQKKYDLTRRERQVAGLLASGCARKQIASSLGVSLGTVRFHLEHLRRKISADSTLAAVARISATLKSSGLL